MIGKFFVLRKASKKQTDDCQEYDYTETKAAIFLYLYEYLNTNAIVTTIQVI